MGLSQVAAGIAGSSPHGDERGDGIRWESLTEMRGRTDI